MPKKTQPKKSAKPKSKTSAKKKVAAAELSENQLEKVAGGAMVRGTAKVMSSEDCKATSDTGMSGCPA